MGDFTIVENIQDVYIGTPVPYRDLYLDKNRYGTNFGQ